MPPSDSRSRKVGRGGRGRGRKRGDFGESLRGVNRSGGEGGGRGRQGLLRSLENHDFHPSVFLTIGIGVVRNEWTILTVARCAGLAWIDRSQGNQLRQDIDGSHGRQGPVVLVTAPDRDIVGVSLDPDRSFGPHEDPGDVSEGRKGLLPDGRMTGTKEEGRLDPDPDPLAGLDDLHRPMGGGFFLDQLHGPEKDRPDLGRGLSGLCPVVGNDDVKVFI